MASRSLLRRLAFSEVALPPSALAAPIKSIDVQMVAAGGTAGNTAARYVGYVGECSFVWFVFVNVILCVSEEVGRRAAPIKSIDVQMVASGATAGNTAARYV